MTRPSAPLPIPRPVPALLAILVLLLQPSAARAQDAGPPPHDEIRQVHDPVLAREGDAYYLFSTGRGIPVRCSSDLETWDACSSVFFGWPDWVREEVPGVVDLWAPDISRVGDRYRLYYSVSTFGSNRSVIGLATNRTLDPGSPDYAWVDEGKVIESHPSDDWNAIDPHLVIDERGRHWLAFGSYWSGIKLVRLDPDTGKPAEEDPELHALASRPEPPRAIEAPFIVYRRPYYYLFVSFDACCRLAESTYNIRVGRAEEVTGPYVDASGVPMLEGGGTLLLEGTERWRGPGHNAVFHDEGRDLLVYHAYDAERHGTPTLRIDELAWGEDGWPRLAPASGGGAAAGE